MRLRSTVRFFGLAALLLAAVSSPAFGRPPVEMVLLADSTPEVMRSAQRWIDTLSAVGVGGVQIRPAQPGEKAGIETHGTQQSPSYRVIGELNGDNVLILPGGRFAANDKAGLRKWLDALGTNGTAGVTEKPGAFGLLSKQTAEVRADLAQTVGFATKGMAPADAIAKIGGTLKIPVVIEAELQQALAAEEPVRDELQDFSCGTALAAMLRPAGAVLRPRQAAGGKLEYGLAKAGGADQTWPIGWPPEESDGKTLPVLLEAHNIELRNIPLSQAVDALAEKLKVQMFWDHNALVKDKIDLQKPVNIPNRKAYYVTVLRQVLGQGGLKYSVRVDEAGKPLIWITSQKSP